jgi:hypothetical protein
MSPDEVAEVNTAARKNTSHVDYRRELAEQHEQAVSIQLPLVKRKFAGVDQIQREQINDYLDREAPSFLKRLVEDQATGDGSWAHWLAHDATDDQVINFLQWNVGRTAKRQEDPVFKETVEQERLLYKQAVAKGVDDDWFSQEALARLDRVDETKVLVADPLETIIRRVRGSALGKEIIIAGAEEGEGGAVQELKTIAPHEFSHASIENVDGSALESRWIREALAEISARVTRPDFASEGYPDEQDLYTALMLDGSERLDIKLGTRAYSGGKAEQQEFCDSLDGSWGTPNTLEKVSAFVAFAEKALNDSGMPYHKAMTRAVSVTEEILKAQPELILGRRS